MFADIFNCVFLFILIILHLQIKKYDNGQGTKISLNYNHKYSHKIIYFFGMFLMIFLYHQNRCHESTDNALFKLAIKKSV